MKIFKIGCLLIAFSAMTFFTAQATVWTVSNNLNSPGQFTTIAAAIDTAWPGDTILVSGSPFSYGDVVINKQNLVLIGDGYIDHNNGSVRTHIDEIFLRKFDALWWGDAPFISGFEIRRVYMLDNTAYTSGFSTLNNTTIERCQITDYIEFPSRSWSTSRWYNNISIRNCLFTSTSYWNIQFDAHVSGGVVYYGNFNNVEVSNCFFNYGIQSETENATSFNDLSLVNIRNNFFSISGTGTMITQLVNAVLENNIFIRRDAGSNSSHSNVSHCSGCSFNNNLTYLTDNDTLPYGTNVGSGNFVGVDPMLNNFPNTGSTFSYAHNYTLLPGSPAIAAGTDGTDLGPFGGAYPFELKAPPRIPQMIEVNVGPPSSVPLNGTLQIQFEGKKQD